MSGLLTNVFGASGWQHVYQHTRPPAAATRMKQNDRVNSQREKKMQSKPQCHLDLAFARSELAANPAQNMLPGGLRQHRQTVQAAACPKHKQM